MTQESLVNPSHLTSLIEANAMLTQQLEAQRKRIQFLETRNEYLEFILEQRIEKTTEQFNPKDHDAMYNRVYSVFLKRPGQGLTYEMIEEQFEKDFRFHSANTGQRVRDLRRDGKVWSSDKDGKVKFYLKLVEAETSTCKADM